MKVLIYSKKNSLQPIGGPIGYLYNLSYGLKKIKDNEIYFLESAKKGPSFKSKIKNQIPSNVWGALQLAKEILGTIVSDGKEYGHSFNEYDAVHFHSTADLYKNRELLKNYTGKIILTSHTPEAPYLEKRDLMKAKKLPKNIILKISKKLKKIDIYSFMRATDIIFPCKEAVEPYLNTFEFFRNNYKKLEKKITYLPTGIISEEHIVPEKKLLDSNTFRVCYIGRHNTIKGYDLLKEAAERIEKLDKNIQFIIAGKQGPLYSNNSLKNWRELGWTNKPLEIEAACNLFVLPNRETYFDLALIEALSAPVVVLISKTGGNKYFERFKTNAINFFEPDDVDDLVNKILFIKKYCNTNQLKQENKVIFKKNFTAEIFAKNYVSTIRSIVES